MSNISTLREEEAVSAEPNRGCLEHLVEVIRSVVGALSEVNEV